MKVELIHKFPELNFPFFYVFDIVAVELLCFVLVTHKLDTIWDSKNFFLSFWFRSHDLEYGIEGNNESFASLTVFREMIEDAFRC